MAARDGRRRVTIADVAQRAGVSTGAVSKVLRNAYGVSPEMAIRVRAAIEDLGYRPHAAARGMRGQTFTIGLLLPELRNPFFADILAGLTETVAGESYQVLLGVPGLATVEQSKLADAMVDRQMDGLVLVAPAMERTTVELTANGVPTVVFGHHDQGYNFDSVASDDEAGAAVVVEHLIGLGHHRIAHTSAPGQLDFGWLRGPEPERRKGYEKAMLHRGLSAQVCVTSYTEAGGYAAGMELLSGPDRPSAIFAGADIAAIGVMRAAAELNLTIPEDLSLVGYDNSFMAEFSSIRLTSVDQQGQALGSDAGRLLIERIKGRIEPWQVTRPPKLTSRSTTAPPAS